jgi:hypothetical protein
VTKRSGGAASEALEVVREITRRAGHEIRNALNGVAVNAEVVRSRADAGGKGELKSFAERAVLQVAVANILTEGLLAFTSSVLAAQAEGTLHLVPKRSAGNAIELMIYGAQAEAVVFAIKRFAGLLGVDVEQHGERVILSVSRQGKSHSKD